MQATGGAAGPDVGGHPRPPHRRLVTGARRALVVAPVAVPLLAAAVVLVGAFGEPFSFWGDKAVEETAVQQATALDRLLGPHSNWRFAHPGPALLYLLAPTYAAAGREPLALSLGALLINAACALGVVAAARRLLGAPGALAAAAVVAAHVWAWSVPGLWEHWNPALVPLPTLLCLVCWAGAWRRRSDDPARARDEGGGRPGAGAGTWLLAGAVPASLVAQSHVGSVPLLAAGGAAGTLGWALGRRRSRRVAGPAGAPVAAPASRPVRRRRCVPVALGVAVAVLWSPVVWEQVTASPGTGNLGRLVTVAREGPDPSGDATGGWPLGTALAAVANEATRLPFRWAPASAPTEAADLAATGVPGVRVALWSAGLALAAGLVVLGLARRRPVLAGLGSVTIATSAAAVVAALRVPDELSNYQLWGASASLLPTWIGAGALAAGAPGRVAGAARVTGVAVAVVAATASCLALRSPRPQPFGTMALDAAGVLGPVVDGEGAVGLSWAPHLWPVVPGALATLRRAGADVRLVGPVDFVVGRDLVVDGTERGVAVLTSADADVRAAQALAPPGACPVQPRGGAPDLRVWFSPARCGPDVRPGS